MIEWLKNIDTGVFFFINNGLQNPIFDFIMPLITNKQNWYPFFLVIIIGLLWKGGKKGRITILLLIPLILLSDQTATSILKPLFHRVRPCQLYESLGTVNMLIGNKTSPSFPSNHASNSFAVAALFSLFYPKYKWIYLSLAGLVGFSRIYVGVHFPFDVLAGALLGTFCAYTIFYLYKLKPWRSIVMRFKLIYKKWKFNSKVSNNTE